MQRRLGRWDRLSTPEALKVRDAWPVWCWPAGITGTLPDGAYLVPEDSLGYLATEVDAFLLNPTGLDDLVSPVIEILLGSPPLW